MKKIILVSSILMCLAFSASTFAQKGKPAPGCGPDVNVNVSIDSYAIAPDVPGLLYTGAIFQVGNCSQDFTMNLNGTSRFINVNLGGTPYTSKFFNFDRVASVPVTPSVLADSAAFLSSQFCTAAPQPLGGFNVGQNTDGTYRDNYAGCGVDESGMGYVRRNVGFGLVASKNTQLGFRFQYSPIDGGINAANVNGTAYVRVYHPNPNNWVIIPDNESNQTLSTPATIDPIGVRLLNGVANGTFIAPFRISVVRVNPI